ncbi:UDP-N-acetylmuramoyl-L-alanine--D-glutamate ligase [Rubinisphaera sp. JC750]|uniref:UDP-N-acetylmuramoyl-L-alanine--D-glutamate ligase n=1 Tax=Rubinisphaera sp. JC750 TaxID=2898658 RepID=UPI001F0130E7|nr:UDP-N-acetylmuramoyl-L-alanine--D-glutamate ligase [Rubinisphaera sp. JC750]
MLSTDFLKPGQKITALGLGRFGGQVAAIRFLAEQGLSVLVSDQADPATLADSIAAVEPYPQVHFRWGPHQQEDFTSADAILISPGIRPNHPCVQAAVEQGIPVLTEMQLFLERNPAPVLAVSGTVGKSTVTTMLAHVLQESGRTVHVGGNLGLSLLPELDRIQPDDVVVLELSSFQLHWLQEMQPRFEGVIVTNLFPHHLDWHGSLAEYTAAKQLLLAGQQENDWAVLPADLQQSGWQTAGQRVEPVCQEQSWPADWPAHWRENACIVLTAAERLGVSADRALAALESYHALPHRLQQVRIWQGRRIIDDSKATSPWATLAGMRAMRDSFWLILGGAASSDDPAELLAALPDVPLLRGIALMGPGGKLWGEAVRRAVEAGVQVEQFESQHEACRWAAEASQAAETILLSPGCPSFNEFLHYEQRGAAFAAWFAADSAEQS